ncbi:gaf domain protein, partial [Cystoisospora suis]
MAPLLFLDTKEGERRKQRREQARVLHDDVAKALQGYLNAEHVIIYLLDTSSSSSSSSSSSASEREQKSFYSLVNGKELRIPIDSGIPGLVYKTGLFVCSTRSKSQLSTNSFSSSFPLDESSSSPSPSPSSPHYHHHGRYPVHADEEPSAVHPRTHHTKPGTLEDVEEERTSFQTTHLQDHPENTDEDREISFSSSSSHRHHHAAPMPSPLTSFSSSLSSDTIQDLHRDHSAYCPSFSSSLSVTCGDYVNKSSSHLERPE